MTPHRWFAIRLLGISVLLIAPPAWSAQDTPLPALREWMWRTEQGDTYIQRREYTKAEEEIKLAVQAARPHYPKTQRLLARSYCDLARVLYHQKRYAEAEPLAKWALSVREADKKASPDAVFQCVYTLGLIEAALKQHAAAESLLQRSLALQEKNLGADHVNGILILIQLATVYIEQNRYSDAETLYARAIAIHERKTPDENLGLADTAEKYAALLRRMNRNDDAARWHARAAAIRDTVATKAARAKADRASKELQGFRSALDRVP
jgi:tetratricopeptide (TPR) repeat protein